MLKFWLKLLGQGIRNPISLLRYFSPEKIRVLVHALRTESPDLILGNFKKLLSGTPITGGSLFEVKTSTVQHPNKILLNVEHAHYTLGRLIFKGWVAASEGVEEMSVMHEGKWMDIPCRMKRPDVAKELPGFEESLNTGFSKLIPIPISPEIIEVRVTDKAGGTIQGIMEVKASEISDLGKIELPVDMQYQLFCDINDLNSIDKQHLALKSHAFVYQPLISVIVPVYNVAPQWLDLCIQSVFDQIYRNWELCLYDDASTDAETLACLKKWDGKYSNVKIEYGKENVNISEASNRAIAMAAGEFIALLDNDDELCDHALFEVAKILNKNRGIDLIYSDEDKIHPDGTFSGPYFKSDYNPDLLTSNNYMCHLAVIRKSVGDEIGWFRKGFEGAQDHDLMLRLTESTSRIHHIPKILYHWRKIEGSTATNMSHKSYAVEAGLKAVRQHLQRKDVKGNVVRGKWAGAYRVIRAIPHEEKVSIIIPFKDKVGLLKECVNSILDKTKYSNYEILLVSNNSEEQETFKFIKKITTEYQQIRLLEFDEAFNYSRINNWAMAQANGVYALLLNNDTEVINEGWLKMMVEHIQRDEVGAVGAKLLYEDNTIQHAGVVIGIGDVAGHAFKGKSANQFHYYNAGLIRNVAACTGACLLVKKDLYLELNGLDEENLKIAFNDIDFCLKVRQAGYLVTYTPYAQLYHYESKSRGYEDSREKQLRFKRETEFMHNKWGEALRDPYYNPNLSLQREDYSLNFGKINV